MLTVDGIAQERIDIVLGLDLSLTGPGFAGLHEPWGDETPRAFATTFGRVPVGEDLRGKTLRDAAELVARRVAEAATRSAGVLVVMEALLLQSGTGKAPERAAFWWMVRGAVESRGYPVVSVHPTTRRSLSHDAEAVAKLAAARAELKALGKLPSREAEAHKRRLAKLGKTVSVETMRRRWPAVALADDNAADALVCADLGARALGWAGMPQLDNKNLPGAIRALGIEKKEMER